MTHEVGVEIVLELEKINKGVECDVDEKYYYNESLPFRRQIIISMSSFMLTLGAGATAGVSAVLIPQLQKEQGKQKFSTEMVSWVAAISSFALIFGNLIAGYFMERFGRRLSQIMLSVPFVCGWIIIGVSNNIHLILLGRFITGVCQGWLGPLGPVFVGEISAPAYRGFLLAALSLGIATGVLMSHIYGTYLRWSTASILCALFPFIGGVITFWAPESPAWLAAKDRIDDCIESFKWYRGNSPTMKVELERMISEQTRKKKMESKIKTLTENIKKPEFWKPLSIMTMFFFIMQLSGVNVICAYTPDMMSALIGNENYSNTAMLVIDVIRCISLTVACILLRRSGRRPLAISSGILTSLSLIALALYLYLVNSSVIEFLNPIITLGLMAIYMIVSNLGIVLLPWNMVGELFATDTRGVGSGISVMMTSLSFFGTVKTAPAMFKNIGFHGAYLFYGLSTLFGTIFLYFCLPETKGKTLLQIEENFRNSKKSKNKIMELM